MNFFHEIKWLIITLIFLILFIFLIGVWFYYQEKQPGKYDQFAQCLKEKKANFYGAFWCPHCQNQKKLFGKSEKYLPYIECSTVDGHGQLKICQEKKIESYPTWEFASAERLTGFITLAVLAEKTGCQLPK